MLRLPFFRVSTAPQFSFTLCVLFALLSFTALASSCSAAITKSSISARPPASTSSLVFAVGDGHVALIDINGKETSRLNVPGLIDGYSTAHSARGSVVLLSQDDRVWEISLEPELAARPVGVVTLPDEDRACLYAEKGETIAKFMHSSRGISVSEEDPDAVCVFFQDRNENMMDVQIAASIELQTGAIKSGVAFSLHDDGECLATAEVCSGHVDPSSPRAKKWRHKDQCTVVNTQTQQTIDLRPLLGLPPGATAEDCDNDGVFLGGESVTGRFITVSHGLQQEDYIYRVVTLLDTKHKGGKPSTLADLDAIGETRVEWATSVNALLFDHEIFILGDEVTRLTVGIGGAFVE